MSTMTPEHLVAVLTYVYTRGYRHGHESTVDGGYIDVNRADYETWHSDVVGEIVAEEPERFAHLTSREAMGEVVGYQIFQHGKWHECDETTFRNQRAYEDKYPIGKPSRGSALCAHPAAQEAAKAVDHHHEAWLSIVGTLNHLSPDWYCDGDDPSKAACAAIQALASATVPIPEGHVMVPVEPTVAMVKAAEYGYYSEWVGNRDKDAWTHSDTYKAMIAATQDGGES